MARRILYAFAIGLFILVLLGACSNNKNADVVIPTLAQLQGANSSAPDQVTPVAPLTLTPLSDVQNGVNQLFTLTAQAQQQIAPTQTLVAAFNQALTGTAYSLSATQRGQNDATMAQILTETAPTATDEAQAISEGRNSYVALDCGSCHGENGQGIENKAPSLIGLTLTQDDFIVFMRLGGKLGASHVFASNRLSDRDAQNLYVYLKSLS